MIPVRAEGLLRTFAEAGVLMPADVHVARRLARLGGESDETVLLASALAVRGVRTGSVCVELATIADTVVPEDDELAADPVPEPVLLPWPADWSALGRSPLVALGTDPGWRPLRLVDGLLYLDRYWQQEQLVRRELDSRAAQSPPSVDLTPLHRLFAEPGSDRQRLAAAVAASRWVSVITGGPGTGKTHTVARLLALLLDQPGPRPRIALAAPTGKAAARLQESVRAQADAIGLPVDLTASTLHRLLGWRPDSRSRFRHDATDRLPFDVVVVDESSMVPLTLMARLLDAVRPTARLVLVGDPDQLTPVEAGAVLSDLVHRPLPAGSVDAGATIDAAVGGALGGPGTEGLRTEQLSAEERAQLAIGVVRLRDSHRFGAGIGALAEAIRAGDADEAVRLLAVGGELTRDEDTDGLAADVRRGGADLLAAATAGDAATAMELLAGHRLLCAHRHGPFGVAAWNEQLSRWTRPAGAPASSDWYPGQPLLITANDYDNGLFNGDAGVVVVGDDGLAAAFTRGTSTEVVPLSRLSSVMTAHALTVHRSQGSQYRAVTVMLPPPSSPLLTRELLYTAVTRAVDRVRVIGSEDSVRAAVGRHAVRASGLRRPSG
ncbi:DNA helicase/exodeoxyribonuclease V, alpha subunit [Klenkia marina]|uniref:RecBCD enzyme subunit RecD n=1 Tax=Klenkia marina TaxID=1960309 RepID=A0A1G4YNP5_9ACTN|nr:exodeoxyribonuclease V subunit alpha [Klenkia marina]SCX55081.1 DNA helicase/exodeoxyribonuclease V, alpha subunit [Klenkia marina]